MKINFSSFAQLCALIVLGVLQGCVSSASEECAFIPDIKSKVDIEFVSLSDSLINLETKEELIDFLGLNPVLRDYFFRRSQYPNDSVFINTLYQRFTNPHIDTLRMMVQQVFGDEQNLKAEFGQAYSNLKYYYPEVEAPRIQTVITGLDNDMYVSDTLIIVSLDYFLGPGAKYRPNMFDYLLRQYGKENIVPSTMLIVGMNRFNYTDLNDNTVLADMMAYGKAFYFAKHMMPCVPDSIFIWYTADEIKGANENANLIWYRLVEDQVLYSTNHVIKQRFLSERPITHEVGEKCPGRIAQWVGWEIVKSYMKAHPDKTLPDLMAMMDADKLFKESKYRPVKK